jgi:1-acyl-sn-glycerol-3-phosphate acyltransferase
VPIVPVAMIGTDHVLPIGRSVPRLGRVGIRIGTPISPPPPAPEGTPEAARQARALTEQVMSAIAALSGQSRADVDCSTHKHAMVGGRRSFASSE